MLILVTLAGICVSGLLLVLRFSETRHEVCLCPIAFIASFFSGVLLLIAVIFVPISRMKDASVIAKFRETRDTIERARENSETKPLENAALQTKVIESNRSIRNIQFWNSTIFDLWHPDEVENLEPIR